MFLNIENRYLLKWVFRQNNFAKTLIWLCNRIIYYILKNNRFLKILLYPKDVRLLSKNILIDKYNHSKVGTNNPKEHALPFNDGFSFQLATINIKHEEDNIDWSKNYSDPEDVMSLHRWKFLQSILHNNKFKDSDINWAQKQVFSWINWAQVKSGNKQIRDLAWDTYTVSERLINCILFFQIIKKNINPTIQNSLLTQAHFVVENLEYNGPHTGNHILNNARALYAAGNALENKLLIRLGIRLLKTHTYDIIYSDGTLREGSSHYQLLITKWYAELLYFSIIYKDYQSQKYFLRIFTSLYKACIFFLYNNGLQSKHIPLFGDISPDYTPKILISILFPNNNKSLYVKKVTNIVTKLLSKDRNANVDSLKNNSKYGHLTGWHKFTKHNSIIFFRLPKYGRLEFSNHSHNDLCHFWFSQNNIPIFIDIGRSDYQTDEMSLSQDHNTITINGLGLLPNNYRTFPPDYGQCINSIRYKENKDILKIWVKSDGFKRIDPKVEFSRELNISKSSLIIIDKLDMRYNYKVVSYFYLNPIFNLSIIDESNLRLSHNNGSDSFLISISAISNKDEPNNYRVKIRDVAYSTSYGERKETKFLLIEQYGSYSQKVEINFL